MSVRSFVRPTGKVVTKFCRRPGRPGVANYVLLPTHLARELKTINMMKFKRSYNDVSYKTFILISKDNSVCHIVTLITPSRFVFCTHARCRRRRRRSIASWTSDVEKGSQPRPAGRTGDSVTSSLGSNEERLPAVAAAGGSGVLYVCIAYKQRCCTSTGCRSEFLLNLTAFVHIGMWTAAAKMCLSVKCGRSARCAFAPYPSGTGLPRLGFV